jgi:hypothetical protein
VDGWVSCSDDIDETNSRFDEDRSETSVSDEKEGRSRKLSSQWKAALYTAPVWAEMGNEPLQGRGRVVNQSLTMTKEDSNDHYETTQDHARLLDA